MDDLDLDRLWGCLFDREADPTRGGVVPLSGLIAVQWRWAHEGAEAGRAWPRLLTRKPSCSMIRSSCERRAPERLRRSLVRDRPAVCGVNIVANKGTIRPCRKVIDEAFQARRWRKACDMLSRFGGVSPMARQPRGGRSPFRVRRRVLLKVHFPPESDPIADISASPSRAKTRHQPVSFDHLVSSPVLNLECTFQIE